MKSALFVIGMLLALPVVSLGWTITLNLSQNGTGLTDINVDPAIAATKTITVDVRLTSDYQYTVAPPPNPKGLDGIQYQVISDHKATDSKFDFPTDGTGWVNGTVFASAEWTTNYGTYPSYGTPYNNLAYINATGAEVGFKGSGAWVLPCTNALVATLKFVVNATAADKGQTWTLSAIGNDYGFGNNPAPVSATGPYTGGALLSIHIVPEPVSALLLAAAIPFLRRRRSV